MKDYFSRSTKISYVVKACVPIAVFLATIIVPPLVALYYMSGPLSFSEYTNTLSFASVVFLGVAMFSWWITDASVLAMDDMNKIAKAFSQDKNVDDFEDFKKEVSNHIYTLPKEEKHKAIKSILAPFIHNVGFLVTPKSPYQDKKSTNLQFKMALDHVKQQFDQFLEDNGIEKETKDNNMPYYIDEKEQTYPEYTVTDTSDPCKKALKTLCSFMIPDSTIDLKRGHAISLLEKVLKFDPMKENIIHDQKARQSLTIYTTEIFAMYREYKMVSTFSTEQASLVLTSIDEALDMLGRNLEKYIEVEVNTVRSSVNQRLEKLKSLQEKV